MHKSNNTYVQTYLLSKMFKKTRKYRNDVGGVVFSLESSFIGRNHKLVTFTMLII